QPTGPQPGGFPPHQQMGPGPQMPGGGNPNMTGAPHGPAPAPPPATGPNTVYGNRGMPSQPPPNMQPRQNQPQRRVEDPILSQGWVVPAVLIAIIILLLVLFLVALSG
ncbi:serine/threonine protein kinase, partial [Streptomonospora algeriensis]